MAWVEARPRAASPLAPSCGYPRGATKRRKERCRTARRRVRHAPRRAEVFGDGRTPLRQQRTYRVQERIGAVGWSTHDHAPRSPPHARDDVGAAHGRRRSDARGARALRRRDDAALPLGDGVASAARCRRGVDFSGPRVGTEGRHSWKGLRENPASSGAGDGTRTRDPELGKLMLYQLSYARTAARLSTLRRRRYSRTVPWHPRPVPRDPDTSGGALPSGRRGAPGGGASR